MAQQLLDRLNYHKTLTSSTNAITHLSKLNPALNESNVLTHAYLASSPAITEQEREIYAQCMKVKAMHEYEMYSEEIKRIAERKQALSLLEQEDE
jgi:hypothetical protein